MSNVKKGDALFQWTEDGQDYIHHLGHPLHRVSADIAQTVDTWWSADGTTDRRISIGSGVHDLTATIRWDGQRASFQRFMSAARRGIELTYIPSASGPSLSFPCKLLTDGGIGADSDFWWEHRSSAQVRFRRTDGGTWDALVSPALFYYSAGNNTPGLTFTRSGTVGPYVDIDGVIQSAAANIQRTTYVDGVPYLLLEAARTNLNSEDDLSAWSTSGTPVVTGSIDDPAGGTGAYTVEDNDGSAGEYIIRTLGFTGDGVKTLSVVIRENTPVTPVSGDGHYFEVWDVTASQRRLIGVVETWTDGEPDVTIQSSTGEHLGSRYIGNGYWQVLFGLDSVTAANNNEIRIKPAQVTGGGTGSLDIYRVAWFDSVANSFSVLDASETRNSDTWYAPFTAKPQAMTVYGKILGAGGDELGSNTQRYVHIGDGTLTSPAIRFDVYKANATSLTVRHANGSASSVNSSVTIPDMQAEDVLEFAAVLNTDGSVQVFASINGAAQLSSSASSALTLPSAWDDERLYLNSAGSSTGIAGYHVVKVAPGVKSLADMRRY